MLEYLAGRDSTAPFFAYLAFQAVHIPVQAPREFTERYRGVYADGWDAVRTRRWERARALGLVPADAEPPLPHPDLRPWASLSPTEQAHYEASMMVNAGMLEAMDHHIGRLADYLATRHALEQTIFIITSDNGPEFGDPSTDRAFRLWMAANAYHTDIERLGERGYMGAIGPEWASVAAVPGRLFKMYASEGGTRVPLMISGPGVEPATGFNGAQSFVVDVAPTIADLTGLTSVEPMDGRSLVPLLRATSSEIRSADEAVALEVAGNAAVFQGTHKLTRNTLPHGDARWRLHDIQRDPAERTDLSVARPALAEALLAHYEAYAAAVGVVPVPDDFNVLAQVTSNTVSSMRERYLPRLLLALLAVLAAGIGFWRVRRHKSPLNETETHT
jgi:arylsulfatase A-like enzyme